MNELEGEKGLCVALRGTTQKHNGNIMCLSTMATGSGEVRGGMDGWYEKFNEKCTRCCAMSLPVVLVNGISSHFFYVESIK